MKIPDKVLKLAEKFNRNIDSYRSGKYNEAQLRSEFVNPFFIALGWDVYNEQGHAEAYKDVIQEDSIKVGGTTKAQDYCFRIDGTKKFFIKTMKFSINIEDDAHSALQLIGYAWFTKSPLSILTDFDSKIKPEITDEPFVE